MISDNVDDLMRAKLDHYDSEALAVITKFSCLGQTGSGEALSRVLSLDLRGVDEALRPFVEADLIHRIEHGYAFAHAGVRDVAYARLDQSQRAEAHLAIGRALAKGLDRQKLEDSAFDVVNQFNRGIGIIADEKERSWLAGLNLVAGKRAKVATAYEAALAYFDTGISLLDDDSWSNDYRCRFELELHRADCQSVLGIILPQSPHSRSLDFAAKAATTMLRS